MSENFSGKNVVVDFFISIQSEAWGKRKEG